MFHHGIVNQNSIRGLWIKISRKILTPKKNGYQKNGQNGEPGGSKIVLGCREVGKLFLYTPISWSNTLFCVRISPQQ